jgi:hypothetical protein
VWGGKGEEGKRKKRDERAEGEPEGGGEKEKEREAKAGGETMHFQTERIVFSQPLCPETSTLPILTCDF